MGFERPVPYKWQFHSPKGHDTPESNACKKDKVEDTKGANRNSTTKKDRKYKDQKDKQWYTEHYTENKRLHKKNHTKTVMIIVRLFYFIFYFALSVLLNDVIQRQNIHQFGHAIEHSSLHSFLLVCDKLSTAKWVH
jgi:cytoskeletal protein RodZ